MQRLVLPFALFSVACGGALSNADTSGGGCSAARDEAARAWTAVVDQADTGARENEDRPPIPAENALDRVHAHAQALQAAPHEITGDEALAISSAVMDAVDEISGELPSGLRERADDAAEALLTDRGEEGAQRAAQNAIAVLEEIVRAIDPSSAETRARRLTLADLARRARDTATAYAESASDGDRRADRAESVDLPPDAPAPLVQARERAVESSARVRRDCDIDRRIAAPSL